MKNKLLLILCILGLLFCNPNSSGDDKSNSGIDENRPVGVPKEAEKYEDNYDLIVDNGNSKKRQSWNLKGILIHESTTIYDSTNRKMKELKSINWSNDGKLSSHQELNYSDPEKKLGKGFQKEYNEKGELLFDRQWENSEQIKYTKEYNHKGILDFEEYGYADYSDFIDYYENIVVGRIITKNKIKYKLRDPRIKDYEIPPTAIFDTVTYYFLDGKTENGKKEGKWVVWSHEGRPIGFLNYKNGLLYGIAQVSAEKGVRIYAEFAEGKMVKSLLQDWEEKLVKKERQNLIEHFSNDF